MKQSLSMKENTETHALIIYFALLAIPKQMILEDIN